MSRKGVAHCARYTTETNTKAVATTTCCLRAVELLGASAVTDCKVLPVLLLDQVRSEGEFKLTQFAAPTMAGRLQVRQDTGLRPALARYSIPRRRRSSSELAIVGLGTSDR